MSIERSVDPEYVGFDSARLARIDQHFARYVDDGRLPGWQIVVTRRGEVAHAATYGMRDREARLPVASDTLWRIYSMTKPITTVAAMMLWEEGAFELSDEVSRWIPAFGDVRVYTKGSALRPFTVPAAEPIRIWHLLTHTAGLTYAFMQTSVVDALYRAAGYDEFPPHGVEMADACAALAKLPLLFQPGTAWAYSVATDVLGHLIEVVSGQRLDEFFAERILGPLGMTDTRWWVPESDSPRLAALYGADPTTGQAVPLTEMGALALQPPTAFVGGQGLISTAADYHRFTQMLLREGELDGVRLLGSRTVRMMTRNQLPGGVDLAKFALTDSGGMNLDGLGFGFGVAVVEDPVAGRVPGSPGLYHWSGMASTEFWVDPQEEITAMLFTQLVPFGTHRLASQLRQLVYSALVD